MAVCTQLLTITMQVSACFSDAQSRKDVMLRAIYPSVTLNDSPRCFCWSCHVVTSSYHHWYFLVTNSETKVYNSVST